MDRKVWSRIRCGATLLNLAMNSYSIWAVAGPLRDLVVVFARETKEQRNRAPTLGVLNAFAQTVGGKHFGEDIMAISGVKAIVESESQ